MWFALGKRDVMKCQWITVRYIVEEIYFNFDSKKFTMLLMNFDKKNNFVDLEIYLQWCLTNNSKVSLVTTLLPCVFEIGSDIL